MYFSDMSEHLSAEIDALIVRHVRQYRRRFLYGGLGSMAIGALLALGAALTVPADRGLKVGLLTFGMFFVLGFGLLVPALLDPTKAKLLQLLRSRPPTSIVWVFAVNFNTRNRNTMSVGVGFEDGARAFIDTDVGKEDEVLDALWALAPHARRDWSEDAEREFATSPSAFRPRDAAPSRAAG